MRGALSEPRKRIGGLKETCKSYSLVDASSARAKREGRRGISSRPVAAPQVRFLPWLGAARTELHPDHNLPFRWRTGS